MRPKLKAQLRRQKARRERSIVKGWSFGGGWSYNVDGTTMNTRAGWPPITFPLTKGQRAKRDRQLADLIAHQEELINRRVGWRTYMEDVQL